MSLKWTSLNTQLHIFKKQKWSFDGVLNRTKQPPVGQLSSAGNMKLVAYILGLLELLVQISLFIISQSENYISARF